MNCSETESKEFPNNIPNLLNGVHSRVLFITDRVPFLNDDDNNGNSNNNTESFCTTCGRVR